MKKNLCSQASGVVIGITLILTLGTIWQFTPGLSPSRAAPAYMTVSLSGERIAHSSAAMADFDGDGDKEIVIGGQDGMLYVLAYNGSSWSVAWSRQTAQDLNGASAPDAPPCVTSKSDIRSAPAIGDMDNDGHLEIVVTTGGDPANHRNGGVLVYRYNSAWSFSLVSGWPQPKLDIVGQGAGSSYPDGCWDGIWSSPALGDLDGDGDLEVVVEGFDRRLHVWHHNGTYVGGWPIAPPDIHRGGWSSPAIADIDRDGLPEVIFATDDYAVGGDSIYYLYVFNGDGSLLPGFPVQTSQNMQSSPAVGDINDDGWLDIVVGTGTYESSGGNKVYAWDHEGNSLPGWPKTTGGNMPASPALGDLDGDGDLEVVIGCGAEGDPYPASCTSLYAWHSNGNLVDRFPMSPPANDGWTPPNGLPYTPVLADYDGDDSVEILILNRWSWGISTVEADGTSNNDSALMTENTLSSSPVVADVDNDGKLEIVIGGANSSGSNGVVYIWDMNGDTNDALPWPMFRCDSQNTGRYHTPPRLSVFPTSLYMMHQYGSGDTERAYLSIRNAGDGSFSWAVSSKPVATTVNPSSGTASSASTAQITVTVTALGTTSYPTGTYSMGNIVITGTSEGTQVEGSSTQIPVTLYIGRVHRTYLPTTMRSVY